MGAGPPLADRGRVRHFAVEGVFGDAFVIWHIRNSFKQGPEKAQGIGFVIVWKLDKAAFLQSVEKCFHVTSGLIDAVFFGEPRIHKVGERGVTHYR